MGTSGFDEPSGIVGKWSNQLYYDVIHTRFIKRQHLARNMYTGHQDIKDISRISEVY